MDGAPGGKWLFPVSCAGVAAGGWGPDGEMGVAQMRGNVVRREKRGGKESKCMRWVGIYSRGQLFPCVPLPYPFADLITVIAISAGTEESSDFTAEEQKGWVPRGTVVL